jgi:hypothetical protein
MRVAETHIQGGDRKKGEKVLVQHNINQRFVDVVATFVLVLLLRSLAHRNML